MVSRFQNESLLAFCFFMVWSPCAGGVIPTGQHHPGATRHPGLPSFNKEGWMRRRCRRGGSSASQNLGTTGGGSGTAPPVELLELSLLLPPLPPPRSNRSCRVVRGFQNKSRLAFCLLMVSSPCAGGVVLIGQHHPGATRHPSSSEEGSKVAATTFPVGKFPVARAPGQHRRSNCWNCRYCCRRHRRPAANGAAGSSAVSRTNPV